MPPASEVDVVEKHACFPRVSLGTVIGPSNEKWSEEDQDKVTEGKREEECEQGWGQGQRWERSLKV